MTDTASRTIDPLGFTSPPRRADLDVEDERRLGRAVKWILGGIGLYVLLGILRMILMDACCFDFTIVLVLFLLAPAQAGGLKTWTLLVAFFVLYASMSLVSLVMCMVPLLTGGTLMARSGVPLTSLSLVVGFLMSGALFIVALLAVRLSLACRRIARRMQYRSQKLCHGCGYDTRDLTSERCPECGCYVPIAEIG